MSVLSSSPKPRSTSQNVYELIRADIVSSMLKPGEAILLRLANLGLVDIFPQSATRVAPIRAAKLRAAQLIREAVEVEAVKRACRQRSEADIVLLNNLVEDLAIAARRGDSARFIELDDEFHEALFAAAGLGAVPAELESVNVHLARLQQSAAGDTVDAAVTIDAHQTIVAAIVARDEARAGASMAALLRAVLRAIDRLAS
jgi:DNA-binding GntR family transcriptional regulator